MPDQPHLTALPDTMFASLRANYTNSDDAKLAEFNRSVDFLNTLRGDVGANPQYAQDGFSVTKDGNRYTVFYNQQQSLKIEHLATGQVVRGFIRQLHDLKMALNDAVTPNSDPLHCPTCHKVHKRYGMEMEFLLETQDANYREVMLRFLNGKLNSEYFSSDYGLDHGGPMEIRNINANNPEDLTAQYKERFDKVKDAMEMMAKFPGFKNGFNTDRCGIHVHMFHKEFTRNRILTAHSIVGLMVNSMALGEWKKRAPSYGMPYMNRPVHANDNQAGRWCMNMEHATELRMFNVLHPTVLKWSMERTLELAENRNSCNNDKLMAHMSVMPRTNNSGGNALFTIPGANHAMKFFIEHGAVKEAQLKDMALWLKTNYLPAHTGQGRGLCAIDVDSVMRRTDGATSGAQPVTAAQPESPNSDSEDGPARREWTLANRDTIQEMRTTRRTRGNWCSRVRAAWSTRPRHLAVSATHIHTALRRHVRRCEACRILTGQAVLNGWRLLAHRPPVGQSSIQFMRPHSDTAQF